MQVYKIINLINGMLYIGATTTSLKQRMSVHIGKSKTSNIPLHRDMRKYGKDNFKIELIEIEPNMETMYEKEQYYIAFYNSMNSGYNCTTGGIDCELSDDYKKKVSENHSHYWLNKSKSKKARQKSREAHLGKKHTQATKDKMSVSRIKYWKNKKAG